jgi:hypothetical protein
MRQQLGLTLDDLRKMGFQCRRYAPVQLSSALAQ